MNKDSLNATECFVTIPQPSGVKLHSPTFYEQFIETMGFPIVLLLLTYIFKIFIHNSAKPSDFWKAAIEFPIDFMSIAISVYVTFRYLDANSNIFLTEIFYFIFAVIICCFSRKAILNNTCVDKMGIRQIVFVVLNVVLEFAILLFVIYYLVSLLQCSQQ